MVTHALVDHKEKIEKKDYLKSFFPQMKSATEDFGGANSLKPSLYTCRKNQSKCYKVIKILSLTSNHKKPSLYTCRKNQSKCYKVIKILSLTTNHKSDYRDNID